MDGEINKIIIVPIVNDEIFELSENFTISLSNASTNTILSTPTSAFVTIDNDDRKISVPPPAPPSTPPKSDGGNCFIATAAYGSYLAPDVKVLRSFRDEFLLTNRLGINFVDMYYQTSPPIAEFIRNHELLRSMTRVMLFPIVLFIKHPMEILLLIIFIVVFCLRQYKYIYRTNN